MGGPRDELRTLLARHGIADDVAAPLIEALAATRTGSALATVGIAFSAVDLDSDSAPATEEVPRIRSGSDRYDDLGPLGRGAMGEVRRVRDRDLNRTVAMKIVRDDRARHAPTLLRFVHEAQVTAQLPHPAIAPVHEVGCLPDGRLYYTMREIRGRPLEAVLTAVHRRSIDTWEEAEGWTFRGLVEALRRVSEAVAFAHDRGVVHRDLKPANVVVAGRGGVTVVDWGLAKVVGRPDLVGDEVVTDRTRTGSGTLAGTVAGTPAYMPPEQARGEVDAVDARSDVFALGAILYAVLTGRPPYTGASRQIVLDRVLAGPPPPPVAGPPLPDELVEICVRAMAFDPADRYADAGEVATEIGAWLEGWRRRERALATVAAARELQGTASRAREQAERAIHDVEAELSDVPSWAPPADKAPLWAKEEAARARLRAAERDEARARRTLFDALTTAPDLAEAHLALAEGYRADHAAAEAQRDPGAIERAEIGLRAHTDALPRRLAAPFRSYLDGTGALTLVTDPAGAEVVAAPWVERDRRLVPGEPRVLGRTPLHEVALPMGRYLLTVRAEGRLAVRYPVRIGRQGHWDGIPPGESTPRPIRLPTPSDLGPDEVYVPAGWFASGGDPDANEPLPARRLWCDGFVVQRTAVTNRDWLAFLDGLASEGADDVLASALPRERSTGGPDAGVALASPGPDGRYALIPDSDGDRWELDWPALLVHFGAAVAYARWRSRRDGLPWRLPGELEWEKAARGVDARLYPWGDRFDPAWTRVRDSVAGRPLPCAVDDTPFDVSPYGVAQLAGNVETWCGDVFVRTGPPLDGDRVVPPALPDVVDFDPAAMRTARGGNWNVMARQARSTYRYALVPGFRSGNIGVRLVRSWP